MVDVTFPFIVLFGGLLVGYVTARVRGHTGARKAADLLVAGICGPLATTVWMWTVPGLLRDQPQLSPSWAFLLADLLWLSPVIGGLIGVGAVAIFSRMSPGGPDAHPGERVGAKIGAVLCIVGWVYTVIAAALAVFFIALAIGQGETQLIGGALPVLALDLVKGPILIIAGHGLARLFPSAGSDLPSPTPKPTSAE